MRIFLRFIPLTRALGRRLRNHIRHCHFTLLYKPPPIYTMRYRGRPPQPATTPLIFTILTLCTPITITRLMVFFQIRFSYFFFAFSFSSTRTYMHTEHRDAAIHAFWLRLGRGKKATTCVTCPKNCCSIYKRACLCSSRRDWCAASAMFSDI